MAVGQHVRPVNLLHNSTFQSTRVLLDPVAPQRIPTAPPIKPFLLRPLCLDLITQLGERFILIPASFLFSADGALTVLLLKEILSAEGERKGKHTSMVC